MIASAQLGVAVAEAAAGAGGDVRGVRHGLHAAGHDDVGLAGRDHLVGEVDRVEARQADLVDVDRRHVHRDAGLHGSLAARHLTLTGHQHLAHDDVLDLVGRHAGTLECGLDGEAAEIGSAERRECAAHLADRRASSGDDVRTCGSHAATLPPPPHPRKCRPVRAQRAPGGEFRGWGGVGAALSAGITRSVTSQAMQQILEAIQSGASGDDLAALPVPESYRAAVVKRDEATMFEGVESSDKDPRESLHVERGRHARAGTRRGLRRGDGVEHQLQHRVDVRSSSRCRPSGSSTGWAARASGASATSLPYHVVGSDASGVVLQVGSAVRNWKPGDRVTVHCNYVDDQDPTRPRRLDARSQPVDLGLRDELRRPRGSRRGQGQPADAQAQPSHVGGGRGERTVQLHLVSDARRRERRTDEAG